MLNVLLPVIEKLRESLGEGGAFEALLSDLSKAFDCLSNGPLIAKLHGYEIDIPSLKLLYSYLTKPKQKLKLNSTHQLRSKIIFGVPQDYLLGPFNIHLCELTYNIHLTYIYGCILLLCD